MGNPPISPAARPSKGERARRSPSTIGSVLAVAGLVVALSAGVGFAAGLAISPKRLTVYTSDTQVPSLQTCALTSSADTYADQLNTLSNFGSATSMTVQSGALTNHRSFARFDLSTCGFASTADIRSATLELYLSSAPSGSRTYVLRRVTETWSEGTLTWSNQPAVADSDTASTATGTTDGVPLQWDVTTDTSSFVDGTATNNGWRIGDSAEGALVDITGTFSTREHATAGQRPSLQISYYP